jgi:hypothetical protein
LTWRLPWFEAMAGEPRFRALLAEMQPPAGAR